MSLVYYMICRDCKAYAELGTHSFFHKWYISHKFNETFADILKEVQMDDYYLETNTLYYMIKSHLFINMHMGHKIDFVTEHQLDYETGGDGDLSVEGLKKKGWHEDLADQDGIAYRTLVGRYNSGNTLQ